MALNSTLKAGSTPNDQMVTFYHVSTEVHAFKSFFREGAKAIGQGVGGQENGFFVWTTPKAANQHIRFLHEDPFADKVLTNNEAIIVGVSVPKSSLSYPVWQQDMEKGVDIFKLWVKHGNFINEHAENLDIPFDIEDKPLGWDFSKFTGFSCEKKISNYDQKQYYKITFEGVDEKGKEKKKTLIRNEDSLTGTDGAYDSVKFQILTDWLCQNSPDFKKDYDHLMQKIATNSTGCAMKYTGVKPLPIVSAQYVKIMKDGKMIKQTLFDISKGKNQVCPFLILELNRKRKEK